LFVTTAPAGVPPAKRGRREVILESSPQEKGRGEDVRQLQELANKRGYEIDIDGDFGTQTYQAVRAFQTQNLDQHGQRLVR
jgi:peptidoglycan hydrolase-like protein with peptidoglycan-binding domain